MKSAREREGERGREELIEKGEKKHRERNTKG